LRQKFTGELVERSARTQEVLLKKAIKLLKPGHEMIYSTCSILAVENEQQVRCVLGREAELVPISEDTLPGVPLLPSSIKGTLCICPDELYEGFFVAKIRKK
jgi:16S rRNA C967 or C1407 C5-methylase (RsmB/RsmF family)